LLLATFNETRQELTVRRDNFARTQELYEETGANRLLSRLPASTTSIGLNTKLFKHALESLQQTRLFESLQVLRLVDKNANPSFVFKTELDFECFYRLASIRVLSVGVSVKIKNYQDNMNVLTGAQKVDLIIVKDLDISDIAMDWLLSTFPNAKEFNIMNSQVQIQTLRSVKPRYYPSLSTFNIKKGEIQDNLFSFMRILAPNIRHLGSVVQGNAYQYRFPRHYFRDRKAAVANGTLDTFHEAPEQTCHYIDLKGYRLISFHLFSNLHVNSAIGEAKLFVEVVLPSSVIQHVYKLNPNSPATYIGLGKDYQHYMIRQMTKVMVVCTILESFQVDNTNAIAVTAPHH
jgi:hypothetical protein